MARYFILLATVALLGTITISAEPQLLTIEQQQNLLEQLAQLQRQTQQLLDAQQSLAAAAADSNSEQPVTVAPKKKVVKPTQKLSLVIEKPTTNGGASNKQVIVSKPKPKPKAKPKAKPVAKPKPTPKPALPAAPQINWGKCPEFEPSEAEKLAKAADISKCLESTPISDKITRESVEKHREQIAFCALGAEGWFNQAGGYNYGKAQKEIKNKRLDTEIELQLLSYHDGCKVESEEKYASSSSSSSSIIAQIQLYQACMDYWISETCGIGVDGSEA